MSLFGLDLPLQDFDDWRVLCVIEVGMLVLATSNRHVHLHRLWPILVKQN